VDPLSGLSGQTGADARKLVPPLAAGRVRYRDVFAVRPYRYLFTANLLSQSGDQLTKVAMSALVLARTGSTLLAATAYAVTYLPLIIGGPLLSAYADRLPRRRVLLACDICRAVLVLSLITPHLPTTVLFVVLFAANLFGSPFNAAQAALMPELLPGDRYALANGLDTIVRQVAQVGGFAAGGIVVWALSPEGALVVDAATFAASAFLVFCGLPPAPAAADRRNGARRSALADSIDAARYVLGDHRLRAYVLLFWVASSCTFAYEAIAIPFAHELGGGPRTAGVLLAIGPLGQVLGIFVLGRMNPRSRMRILLPMAVLSVAALIPVLAADALPAVLACIGIAGVGSAFQQPLNTLFGRAVPDEYRGRAFGLVMSGLALSYAITMLTAGAVAGNPHIGERVVVGTFGAIGTAAVLALTKLWPRDDPAAPTPAATRPDSEAEAS
jgi:MFS family permease